MFKVGDRIFDKYAHGKIPFGSFESKPRIGFGTITRVVNEEYYRVDFDDEYKNMTRNIANCSLIPAEIALSPLYKVMCEDD